MRVATFASLAGESVTVEKVEHLLRDLLREEASRQVTHRCHPEGGGRAFRRPPGGHDQPPPAGEHRLSPADRHVSEPHADQGLADGDRRGLRRARPRHGDPRLQEGHRADGIEPSIRDAIGVIESPAALRPSSRPLEIRRGRPWAAILHRSSQKACQGAAKAETPPINHPGSPSMKFRISKEAFLDGLQKVQHVVSTRTTLPILSNVLLVAKDGRLQFTTTDLDVGITGSVEAQIDKEGATTLPAKRLVSIVRELPASEVEVSVDAKNHASIRSGPSFFKIIGLGEDGVPAAAGFRRTPRNSRSRSSSARRPEEDLLRDLHRRDPLRAQRHLHLVPRGQDDAGRHRRPPPRDGRYRPRVSRQSTRPT